MALCHRTPSPAPSSVGASASAHSGFVIGAPDQGCDRRRIGGGLVHRSDQGVPYVSTKYTERLVEAGFVQSVGSIGDGYDNGLAETINRLYKAEMIWRRATQRRTPKIRDDEAALTDAIVRFAKQYGRYGYRRVRRLLVDEGWRVTGKRVYRIWRREGLKVPKKQPKRGRPWLNDGSCIRLRPERPDHVWSYEFVQDRTQDGGPFGCSP